MVVVTHKNNSDTYTVDIDGRFALSNHNHDDENYLESEIDNFDGTTSITGYNRERHWNTIMDGETTTANILYIL